MSHDLASQGGGVLAKIKVLRWLLAGRRVATEASVESIVARMRLAAGLALALTALSACVAGVNSRPEASAPGTQVSMPAGQLAVAAWLPDGWIYVLNAGDLSSKGEIWRGGPGRTPVRVILPDAPGCRLTEYLLPHRLPDGRLGLARSCSMEDPEQDHLDLVAYRPADGAIEALVAIGLNNPEQVSWRRDLSGGYLSYSSGICEGFGPFTRQGLVRFPHPTTVDGHTWRLDEILFTNGGDCANQGRATSAVMTPDEQRLVFLSAPTAQGHGGQTRLDYPENIYLQALPDGPLRTVRRGFSDFRGVDMAPDGKHLAIAGRRGSEQGLWIVDLDTGAMRKLTGAHVSSPSYEPGGHRISVTLFHDITHSDLRVLDV
jgi:hypothetical protein